MLKAALDTNCFIDACCPESHAYPAMEEILSQAQSGKLTIFVSLHTLEELKTPAARKLAGAAQRLPYYPIGTIGEFVGTIGDIAGTIGDMKSNQRVQEDIMRLAKAGNCLRDRGAYIDALLGRMDVFVTSDKQLSADGPAKRIADKYSLEIQRPQRFAEDLERRGAPGL